MGNWRPLQATAIAIQDALNGDSDAAEGRGRLGCPLAQVVEMFEEEVGGGNLIKGLRGNGGFDPIHEDPGIVDERGSQTIYVQFKQGHIGALTAKADQCSGTSAGSSVRTLGAREFLDNTLVDEVLHDGGDAGMTEARDAGEGRARLRSACAQRSQQQPAVQPTNAITIADGSRQAQTSPTPEPKSAFNRVHRNP